MTTAISVKNVGKRYRIGAAQTKFRYGMLRDVFVDTLTAPARWIKSIGRGTAEIEPQNKNFIWALNDVSFDLDEGRHSEHPSFSVSLW